MNELQTEEKKKKSNRGKGKKKANEEKKITANDQMKEAIDILLSEDWKKPESVKDSQSVVEMEQLPENKKNSEPTPVPFQTPAPVQNNEQMPVTTVIDLSGLKLKFPNKDNNNNGVPTHETPINMLQESSMTNNRSSVIQPSFSSATVVKREDPFADPDRWLVIKKIQFIEDTAEGQK